MKLILKNHRIPGTNQTATEAVEADAEIEWELQMRFKKFIKGWDLDKTVLVFDEGNEGKFVMNGEDRSMEFLTKDKAWRFSGWMQHPTLGATFMMYRVGHETVKIEASCVHPGVGWAEKRGNNRSLRAAFKKVLGV